MCVSSIPSLRFFKTYQVVQDLVSDDLDHLKGLRRSYRVHKHVPVDPNEVLRVENTVLILHPESSVTQYLPVDSLHSLGQQYQ